MASKTKAALDAGLSVILCIGESLEVCVAFSSSLPLSQMRPIIIISSTGA